MPPRARSSVACLYGRTAATQLGQDLGSARFRLRLELAQEEQGAKAGSGAQPKLLSPVN
jgi:hypothetical protein